LPAIDDGSILALSMAWELLGLIKPFLEMAKKAAAPVLLLATSFFVFLPESWLEVIGVLEIWKDYRGIIGTVWFVSGAFVIVTEVQRRLEKRAERNAAAKRQTEIVAEIKLLSTFQQDVLVKFYQERTLELTLELAPKNTLMAMVYERTNLWHEAAEALAYRGLLLKLGQIGANKTLFRMEEHVRKAIEEHDWEDTPVMLQVHPGAGDRFAQQMIDQVQAADAADAAKVNEEGATLPPA
jgi:Super-infection exclusion protein B